MRYLQDIYAPSVHFTMFACEPKFFDDVVKEGWIKVMDEEMNIERNMAWELQNLPLGKERNWLKRVLRTNSKKNGSIQKRKAHLVAKDHSQ